jgi:peptide/nickel transport system substrate-binding protein
MSHHQHDSTPQPSFLPSNPPRAARHGAARWRGAATLTLFGASLAACGTHSTANGAGSKAPTGAGAHTLNLAFTEDTQPLDPDVYYAGQGLVATTAMYQGLVQYQPEPVAYTGRIGFEAPTTKSTIVPDLATSWSISPDGLTYTFHLRGGVHFHDGTPFTSAAVAADFKRRLAVNGGPAYQLVNVTSVSTPSALVAVVHLRTPTSAFMDYLASAYGPKMISPTVLADHAGSNHAQAWLTTHDGGTGPYTMTKAVPGQEYDLSYYPGYWGARPFFTKVVIKIIPDISTQEIEFEDGQLSLLLQGLNTQAISQFSHSSKDRVYEPPTLETSALWVNPKTPVLSTRAARADLDAAINKAQLVQDVYPGRAIVATQIYPAGEMPEGTAMQDPAYDPNKLETFLSDYRGPKNVILGYDQADPADEPLADLMQAAFEADGLQVTVKGYTDTALYGFPTNPTGAPDLVVDTNWPDAAAPDTWARIVMYKGGGLNYFECSVPQGDSLLDKGLSATAPSQVQTADEQAGAAYAASGCWDVIADRGDTIVAPAWMAGIVHQVPVPETVVLADLHPGSA